MRAINRAALGTGLALAACVMSLPATATAQGNYPKAGSVERKIVRKDQKVAQKIRRTTRRGTIVERRRILCGDGTWALSGAACANHDGVAARQVEVKRVTPVASVRARERANVNSAVARSAYVNRTRAGAIARCADGTYWHARTRTSACANHGGVANWL